MTLSLSERFKNYLEKNPHVYDLFVHFTMQAINAGKNKISAWLIINRIRWETDIVIRGNDKFKISNDYAALLSRKFMADYPEHSDIFNTKEMKRC